MIHLFVEIEWFTLHLICIVASQVCLQAATNVSQKYVGSVVYLDTGNCFSPQRIAQFVDKISGPALKEVGHKTFTMKTVPSFLFSYSSLSLTHTCMKNWVFFFIGLFWICSALQSDHLDDWTSCPQLGGQLHNY